MRKLIPLDRWCIPCLMAAIMFCTQATFGQEGLDAAIDLLSPLQLNSLQTQALGSNRQLPPYEWADTYDNHPLYGFVNTDLRLDSSSCETGIPGTMNFQAHVNTYYAYDAEGRVSSITYQVMTTGIAKNYRRRSATYTTENQVASHLWEIWDENTNTWLPNQEEQFTYNSEGEVESLVQRSDISGTEIMTSTTYSYDPSGSISEVLIQQMNDGTLENLSRQTFQNNNLGIPQQIALETWEDGAWLTQVEERSLLGDFGLEWEAYRISQRNENTGELEFLLQENYNYNARGFWTDLIQQVWDGSDWVNTLRQRFSYENSGKWKSWTQQMWENGEWKNSSRHLFDANSTSGEERFQTYQTSNDSWENVSRVRTNFDARGVLTQETGPQLWTGSDWVNTEESQRCSHYVNAPQVSTARQPLLPALDCMVINPYSLGSHIQCSAMEPGNTYQVYLTDLNGRKLFDQRVRGGESFQLNPPSISTGIYFLHVLENGRPRFQQKLWINP